MKKLSFVTVIIVFLLFISNGIQGQTTQTPLDQLKLMQRNIGVWQADYAKDTIQVWDCQPYGKASIINVYWLVKGQKTPFYINNITFNSKEGKFYGFALWPDGGKNTWTGSYVSEYKLSGEMSTNYNPEKVWGKLETIYESPSAFTWHQYNMEGAIVEELKFTKVK
jgi:hypothetical protein